jgi:hypothetical protein
MLINQSEWAQQKEFSRKYVSKLVKQGTIRLVDGKVDTEQAERSLAAIRNPAREPQRKVEAVTCAIWGVKMAQASAKWNRDRQDESRHVWSMLLSHV